MKHSVVRILTLAFAAFSSFIPSAAVAEDHGLLRAGAARVDITPPVNPQYPPSGKYAHERLYIRAIVLDNGVTRAALIGADQSGLSEEVWQIASKQIAAELNCPVENIILSATHTHSSVAAGPPPVWHGGPPPQEAGPIVAAIMKAVHEAKGKLMPAKIGFGTGFSYLNVGRDAISEDTRLWTQASNLHAASDKTVAVVKITTLTGEPIATYVNYAMHPINAYLAGITSADFPGAACRYVEQAFDDKMVMIFSQGASGDQNPLLMRPATNALASISGVPITGYELVRESVEAPLRDGKVPYGKIDPKIADNLERWIESEGMLLGEEVIRVMTNTTRMSDNVSIWGAQKMLTCPGRLRTNMGREGSPGTYQDGEPVNLRLGVVGIGDIALTSVDAEIYTLIAQRMKKQSPLTNTVVVTLANGRSNSGYVPNDEAFGAYTFQVLGSHLKPGCAETGIADGLVEMIIEHTGK